jgi:hypothetical protein
MLTRYARGTRCAAYIAYVCMEAINKKKPCCCCLSCVVILVALLVGYFYAKDILGLPPL